jgi:replication factor A1
VNELFSAFSLTEFSSFFIFLCRWVIKARITSKSEIRSWNNAKGSGQLFSIDLLDATGGEIRGTFFKDACDKFFPMLQEGKVRNDPGY